MKPKRKTFPPIRPIHPDHLPQWVKESGVQSGTKSYFRMGLYSIWVGVTDDGYYNMTITHPTKYPDWDVITHVRYSLLPNDCTMAMMLPPLEKYISNQANMFHLVEIKSDNPEWSAEQMRGLDQRRDF
jgi:hypothetical protein